MTGKFSIHPEFKLGKLGEALKSHHDQHGPLPAGVSAHVTSGRVLFKADGVLQNARKGVGSLNVKLGFEFRIAMKDPKVRVSLYCHFEGSKFERVCKRSPFVTAF